MADEIKIWSKEEDDCVWLIVVTISNSWRNSLKGIDRRMKTILKYVEKINVIIWRDRSTSVIKREEELGKFRDVHERKDSIPSSLQKICKRTRLFPSLTTKGEEAGKKKRQLRPRRLRSLFCPSCLWSYWSWPISEVMWSCPSPCYVKTS